MPRRKELEDGMPKVIHTRRTRLSVRENAIEMEPGPAAASSSTRTVRKRGRPSTKTKLTQNQPQNSSLIVLEDTPQPNREMMTNNMRIRVNNFIDSGNLVSSDDDDDDIIVVKTKCSNVSGIQCISDDSDTELLPISSRYRNKNRTKVRNDNTEPQPGPSSISENNPGVIRGKSPRKETTDNLEYESERKQIEECYHKTLEILESTTSLIDKHVKNTEQERSQLGNCPICLEPLQQSISSTICGHLYCTPCIVETVKSTKTCPICRAELTLKKIHPIYLAN